MTTKVIAGGAQNVATKHVAANRAASGDFRHDWKLGEVEAIYRKPLAKLVITCADRSPHTPSDWSRADLPADFHENRRLPPLDQEKVVRTVPTARILMPASQGAPGRGTHATFP